MKITGADALKKKLRQNATLSDVKHIVKSNTVNMNSKMQNLAPVDTGYMKRSITSEFTDAGLTGTTQPHTDYAGYVEYGTRFQEEQPFVRPAFEEQKKVFINDLNRIMK
ncbi:HK97 gp10 family phage protein [Lactococcus cremoris]|uniref:HK97-gp10 family putative phage morphogenesis protein n=1 Tax=Lactococcus lactis subsp. cremoris TaxID=1359 RepID=UPI003A80DD58